MHDPVDVPYLGAALRAAGPYRSSRAALGRAADPAAPARVQCPTYPAGLPIAIADAEGTFVRDLDGNVFIDFLTGAGVLSLGHNHPELVAAMAGQLGTSDARAGLAHAGEGRVRRGPAVDAAAAQCQNRMKIHFCGPTGANAVDAAIKLCKTATGRGDVVSFQGGFHGSSHLALSLTGLVEQKAPIANTVPGVHFFPYSYCSRCPLGLSRTPARSTARPSWSAR